MLLKAAAALRDVGDSRGEAGKLPARADGWVFVKAGTLRSEVSSPAPEQQLAAGKTGTLS